MTAQTGALQRLWTAAVDVMVFNHPDPNVRCEPVVFPHNGSVMIHIRMWGLRDTANPKWRVSPLSEYDRESGPMQPFSMVLHTSHWPGYEAAEVALAGAWVAYMAHETLELVRRRGDKDYDRAPWHPHATPSLAEDVNGAVTHMIGACSMDGRAVPKSSFARVLEPAVGTYNARRILERCEAKAAAEWTNELRYAYGDQAVDQ